MKEQRIQVLISIANALSIALMSVTGALYVEWKTIGIVNLGGIFLVMIWIFSGIFTIAVYAYLIRITELRKDG